jgi:hypothetical protein
MSAVPALVETGARPSLGTLGISAEAKPVEELTPGCERNARVPASTSATGFLLRAAAAKVLALEPRSLSLELNPGGDLVRTGRSEHVSNGRKQGDFANEDAWRVEQVGRNFSIFDRFSGNIEVFEIATSSQLRRNFGRNFASKSGGAAEYLAALGRKKKESRKGAKTQREGRKTEARHGGCTGKGTDGPHGRRQADWPAARTACWYPHRCQAKSLTYCGSVFRG